MYRLIPLVLVHPVFWIHVVVLRVLTNPCFVFVELVYLLLDQFATYDLSFCIAMSTLNIMQNADMVSTLLCRAFNVGGNMMRLPMFTGSGERVVH